MTTSSLRWTWRLLEDGRCPWRQEPTRHLPSNNQADSARTKHIDVCYHFVRDAVQREEVQLRYCRTGLNCADIFTKPLAEDKVLRFRTALGVC